MPTTGPGSDGDARDARPAAPEEAGNDRRPGATVTEGARRDGDAGATASWAGGGDGVPAEVERARNASPRDTRAGYGIFLAAGGAIELADLNARLVAAGYGPVAPRTYRHYGNLLRAGYDRYISINRFDVARAAKPYENSSASSRYSYRASDLGVSVLFDRSGHLVEAFGRATEIGDAGCLVTFADAETIDGLGRLRPPPGSPVTARFLETGRVTNGRVVEVDLLSRPAVVELEFTRLVSIVDTGAGEALPLVDRAFLLRGRDDVDQTLELVNRRLYNFMELLEGVRALANRAGATQPDPVYAPPPVLTRLTVASPAVLAVRTAEVVGRLLPYGPAAAVLGAAWRIPALRQEWYETRSAEDSQLTLLDIEARRIELDNGEHEAALAQGVLRAVRESFPLSSLAEDEIVRLIDEHVLRPLRALGRDGVTEVVDATDELHVEAAAGR